MNTLRKTLALMGLLSSAALAQTDSETRDLSDFDSIEVGGGIHLTLTQGTEFSVEVTAEDGDLSKLITEVRGDTLRIHREWPESWGGWRGRDWNDWEDEDYSASITLPALEFLQVSGGTDVETTNTFTGEKFTLRASGGSDIVLAVEVDTLRVDTSGGSDVDISGTANRLRAESSGGSDLDAADLVAKEADIRSSGGSDARVSVTDSIIADASGGSDIHYTGDPQYKDIDTSGSGDVRHR
jgi:hypothetical protein